MALKREMSWELQGEDFHFTGMPEENKQHLFSFGVFLLFVDTRKSNNSFHNLQLDKNKRVNERGSDKRQ